jgi:dihydroflavonol-4-reductase
MKTLITGASGFVGAAVLRRLYTSGHDIRALLRPRSDRRNLDGLPVEIVTGDVRDPHSLVRALKGCHALFHVAADYRLWVPSPREMYETNVNGVKYIMMAAAKRNVERIVYTSSVATLGLHSDGRPADEDTPASVKEMVGHYKRSKFLAEELVRRFVREWGLPAVIVNPSTPIGPRDIKPTPTGQVIVQAASGQMPAYVNTGLNLVDVDDVAVGHLLAYDRGRVGERYILGGRNMTLKEILSVLDAVSGCGRARHCLPHNLVLPLAYVTEALARLTRRAAPMLTVNGVKLAKKQMFFSIEKARHELGYRPRSVERALRDAVDWFRKNGYIS